jgi:3',5'-nucleoside bisphosphate phosphatase
LQAKPQLRFDLHAHSHCSDGSLSPTELVATSKAAAINLLALTDHDSVDGLAEAAAAAQAADIRFINGVELSVYWSGQNLHVLGLGIDSNNAELQAALERQRHARDARNRQLLQELEKRGIASVWPHAVQLAKGRILSRTHVARALVEQGHAANGKEAFERWLARKEWHDPDTPWLELDAAIQVIQHAGGEAVIAHPLRYDMSNAKLRKLCDAFAALGGEGIEVLSGVQNRQQTEFVLGLALRHGLRASMGSDFHGPHQTWLKMGYTASLPPGARYLQCIQSALEAH